MPNFIQRLPKEYATDGFIYSVYNPKDSMCYFYTKKCHGYSMFKKMKVVIG